jgi:hypothetical protein
MDAQVKIRRRQKKHKQEINLFNCHLCACLGLVDEGAIVFAHSMGIQQPMFHGQPVQNIAKYHLRRGHVLPHMSNHDR